MTTYTFDNYWQSGYCQGEAYESSVSMSVTSSLICEVDGVRVASANVPVTSTVSTTAKRVRVALANLSPVLSLSTGATSSIHSEFGINCVSSGSVVGQITAGPTINVTPTLVGTVAGKFTASANVALSASSTNTTACVQVLDTSANITPTLTNTVNPKYTFRGIINATPALVGTPTASATFKASVTSVPTTSTTYTVTVANVSGYNVFVLNGVNRPVLNLVRGNTYVFNQTDVTNNGHPLAFKETSGASYLEGITQTNPTGAIDPSTGSTNNIITFVVPLDAPANLKYYCTVHGEGMGNEITTAQNNLMALNLTTSIHRILLGNPQLTTTSAITVKAIEKWEPISDSSEFWTKVA